MRKYQQLFLVLLSLISVSVLFMYKTENNRLKYVLQVVNFFGRMDSSRLENITKENENHQGYYSAMPVWQRIGSQFHAYSSFWNRNELMAGGEAIVLTVGLQQSIINFKCALKYDNGKTYPGKFVFVHLLKSEQNSYNTMMMNKENLTENFNIFKFICKITRDFGAPENVIFTEIKAKTNHELMLRYIKNNNNIKAVPLTVCLNLVPYNDTDFQKSYITKKKLLQFFMHHHGIGIENFIVYNADLIPFSVQEIIGKTSININYFPYNFPFNIKTNKTRHIIETDCLMRTMYISKYVILLNPNELFYPNNPIQSKESIIQYLNNYDNSLKVNRFEIPTYSVCIDNEKQLLIDNYLYNPDIIGYKSYIYRPLLNNENSKSITLTTSKCFTHKYIDCLPGSDDYLHDWRNLIRKDFMKYIMTIRTKLSLMF